MIKKEECYICKSISEVSEGISRYLKFYTCPVCGRYEIPSFEDSNVINKNHLGLT